VDSSGYYGGDEAALSLQDAKAWVNAVNKDGSQGVYSRASISDTVNEASDSSQRLSFSRAYSLALAPQLIYTESQLLPLLVSSKIYRQLEFLAMGTWWVFSSSQQMPEERKPSDCDQLSAASTGTLMRIPTTREDVVFSDKSIDLRSKRAVMKILRFVMDYENQGALWEPYSSKPFSEFLTEQFKLPQTLHDLFFALTLSLNPSNKTSTSFALPRIARHLRSTGKLGPGFNAVIPKWGGLSEIAQAGCRASAVGGAVYVLGKGIKHITKRDDSAINSTVAESPEMATDNVKSKNSAPYTVQLDGDEIVNTEWIAGVTTKPASDSAATSATIYRSISIVSSPLQSLYPSLAEGSPPPSGSVVIFPSGSIGDLGLDTPPVYVIIHSSDTGECPIGQCKSALFSSFLPPRMMILLYEYLSTLSATSLLNKL
jgi:RAB protein geranylgeranyltransferase component A